MLDTKKFIPSFKQNTDHPSDVSPYLFFHIPKSAGMSLVAGIASCYERVESSLPYRIWYGRADNPTSSENHTVITSVKNYMVKHGENSVGGFVASHNPTLVLEKLAIQFKMITVLRRTEDRVLSAYNYHCMRANKAPTSEGFNEFICNQENRDVSVKTLLGIKSISGGEAIIAASLIKESFYAYCFIEDIDLLMTAILSVEGLPNLQIGQENKTIDTFRYIPSEMEVLKVKELNNEDELLIKTLGYGSIKLPEFNKSEDVSQNVVCILSQQSSQKYGYNSRMKRTHQVI